MADETWRGIIPATVRRARGTIFHYTDPGGLLGVIEKKELWATEATGMNDVAEVRQGWAFIRNWLEGQDDDDVTKIMRRIAFGDPKDPDSEPEDGVAGAFMCCASTRGDDANQWRLYAGSGRGYSVALNASVPLAAITGGSNPRGPSGSSMIRFVGESVEVSPWLHVIYRDSVKRTALDGLLDAGRRGWARAKAQASSDDELENDAEQLWELTASGLTTIAQLMKSKGFEGENEVRVVVYDPLGKSSKFRASTNGAIQYVRLAASPTKRLSHKVVYEDDLGTSKTLPLRSVRLGPLIHAQNNKATVRALLRRNGFRSVTIDESEIPLR